MIERERLEVITALAPKGMTACQLKSAIQLDPYQSRLSKNPILLTHPRTGKSAPLKEFAIDITGDSRLVVECCDAIVGISMVRNSAFGDIFITTVEFKKN